MNLMTLAENDLAFTLEDVNNGFGVALTLIDESENEYIVNARVNDIGFFIDLQSGAAVVGRQVEATVRISSLSSQSNNDPPNNDWTAKYTDNNNITYNLAVACPPYVDRTLGVYLFTLEALKEDE